MKTLACFLVFTVGVLRIAEGSVHKVLIEGMTYSPSILEIHKGDIVRWENKDLVPHTVTADQLFDSGSIDPNGSYQVRIRKRGDISYVCRFHPMMKALIHSK